ncbi:MAG TPA: thermonuclease family protein [Motilibacteraceae bacterium]|nr:thermonuclease family protein [Motilibacteraceae bacterium]
MRPLPALVLSLVVGTGLLAGCQASAPPVAVPTSAASLPAAAAPVPADAFRARVLRVVDGDTFLADPLSGPAAGRSSVRVRLVAVNAPESVKPDAPVECWGPQASHALAALLPPGTRVRAAYEGARHEDEFGRQLWHVWLPDGRFLEDVLVSAGDVRPVTYAGQDRFALHLSALARTARASRAGLWGACHAPR